MNANRAMESNLVEILDDSDSDEVVCLFSRKPLLSKSKENKIVNVDSSDDDIEYISCKPPSRADNLSAKKTRRSSSKWIGQSKAKKIKVGVDNVVVHKTSVPRFASVRTETNEARPLRKTGASISTQPHKPIAIMRSNASNDIANTRPKSILHTNTLLNATAYLKHPSSTTMMTNHPTQRTDAHSSLFQKQNYPSTTQGDRVSSKYVAPVIDLNGPIRPPTPPIPSCTPRGTDTAHKSLPKLSHTRPQHQNAQTPKTDTNPLNLVRQSPSMPRTSHCYTRSITDHSRNTSPAPPDSDNSKPRPSPPLIKRCMSPTDAVDVFIYPLPDDPDPLDQIRTTVKENESNVRPSTPPLVNYCVDHIDVDNVLLNPKLEHLDLAPSSDSDSSNDLEPDDGVENTSLCPPLAHEEQFPKNFTSAIENDSCNRPSTLSIIQYHHDECNDDDNLPSQLPLDHVDVAPAPGLDSMARSSKPYVVTSNCRKRVDGGTLLPCPPFANVQKNLKDLELIQQQKTVTDDNNLLFRSSSSHIDVTSAHASDGKTEMPAAALGDCLPNVNDEHLFLGSLLPQEEQIVNECIPDVESDTSIRPPTPSLEQHQVPCTDNVYNISAPLDGAPLSESESTTRLVPPSMNHTTQCTRSDNSSLKNALTEENQVQQELSCFVDKNNALQQSTSSQMYHHDIERADASPKSVHLDINPLSDSECGIRTSPLLRRNVQGTDSNDYCLHNDDSRPPEQASPLLSPRVQMTDTNDSILNHALMCDAEVTRDDLSTAQTDNAIQISLTNHAIQSTMVDDVPTYQSSVQFDVYPLPDADCATLRVSEPPLAMFWSDDSQQMDAEASSFPSQEQEPIDDVDRELPASMVIIPHLSRKWINKATNLPVWKFSVYGEDDSIIYSFRAFAAKSKLPGAGMGAYLEFMGVKRLNKRSNERRLRLLYQLDPYESLTMQPLQAYPRENGSGVTVFLKGNNLHGNNNRHFQLKQLVAVIPKDYLRKTSKFKKSEKLVVRLIAEEDLLLNIEYDANYIQDDSPMCPIGHLRVQTDCDYHEENSVTEYFSNKNCIDLGRYGPFQKTDRKPEDFFVLKSFIFSNVPAEWSFGALEMMHGMQQIIDITDDITGTPTDLARKEIPMYVNEVGYNKSFVQNVYIKDSYDERAIQYYFMPDAPMQKGVPVELLTNYKSAYESVRERKGYGQNNAENGLKSDSCHATCLQRNFLEREDIENIVNDCTSMKRLGYLLHGIDRKMYNPLIELVRNGQQLTPLQWVAVRRIQWIINVFRLKLRNKNIIDLEEKMNDMERTYVDVALPYLRTNLSNFTYPHISKEIKSAMNFELLEEICFPVRLQLPHILDATRYYPAAIRLTVSLCHSIAKVLILPGPGQVEKDVTTILYNKFMEYSLQAKNESFSAGSRESNINELTQVVMIIDAFASVYLKNSTYSMQSLCSTLNLDYEQANAASKSLQQLLVRHIEVKDNKPRARKDGKRTHPVYGRAELVYSGPPTIPFPGNGSHWPDGWSQVSYKRASGATKGRVDMYWYPPEGAPKLRSRVEIRNHIAKQVAR